MVYCIVNIHDIQTIDFKKSLAVDLLFYHTIIKFSKMFNHYMYHDYVFPNRFFSTSKVVHNVGLCIALWDITKIEDSFIFPGDGASHSIGKVLNYYQRQFYSLTTLRLYFVIPRKVKCRDFVVIVL